MGPPLKMERVLCVDECWGLEQNLTGEARGGLNGEATSEERPEGVRSWGPCCGGALGGATASAEALGWGGGVPGMCVARAE